MSYAEAFAPPVYQAPADTRAAYLRKVAGLTFLGLGISSLTGMLSAGLIAAMPFLYNPVLSMILVMGCFFAAQYGARAVVFRADAAPVKILGFLGGAGLQGVAMGYLLLAAAVSSMATFGNPFVLVIQAMGLVGLTAFGFTAYLLTGPRNLSRIGGVLSALSLPMFVLMIVSFFFPIGGVFGILMSAGFVVFSAGALIYQLEKVIHELPASRVVEGAFLVTMGLLVLFWNVLSLLLRLQRR